MKRALGSILLLFSFSSLWATEWILQKDDLPEGWSIAEPGGEARQEILREIPEMHHSFPFAWTSKNCYHWITAGVSVHSDEPGFFQTQ